MPTLISAVETASVQISFVSENLAAFIQTLVVDFDFFHFMTFEFFKNTFEDETQLYMIALGPCYSYKYADKSL